MNTKLLKQKILDLAIRGKLVPQDPNDEPASELLKRICAEKEKLIAEGKIKRPKETGDKPHYENIRANRMQNQTCLSSAEVQPNEGVANVPFEIPESWEWCKIANLGEIVTGTTPSKLVGEYYNGEYPFYKPTDLEQGINTLTSSDSLTLAGLEASRCLPKESILVTCIGATIGKTGVIQRNGSCNQQINAIIPYSHSNPLYIYYCIISGFMQNAIKSNASATTLPILNKTDFSNLLFPLPPFDEQKRIVAEVEKWFVLIDEIEAHKSDLQEYIKQAKSKVLDIAIHGKLVSQDPNDEPAIELLKRINPTIKPCDTSHYGNLPKGWAVCRLEDIVEYEQPSQYIVESTDYSDEYKTPVLTPGKSFILGYTNETKGIYTNIPTIIFDDFTTDSRFVDFPFKVKSSAMKILQVKKEINIKYVAYFMSVTRLVGDTHKRYWISEYSKIPIPIPPRKEQDRIVQKIQEIEKRIQEICEEL